MSEDQTLVTAASTDTVKALTHKLGMQTLADDRLLKKEDHDSGTESDKENSDNEVCCFNCSPSQSVSAPIFFTPPISNKRPFQPLNHSRSSSHLLSWQQDKNRCYKAHDSHTESQIVLSDFFLSNCVSCTSDLDGYSSEDELTSINCDDRLPAPRVGGKRSWSKIHSRSEAGRNSVAWSDEGLQEDASPMPLNFSSSPPKGVCLSHTMSPKVFLASVLPVNTLCSNTAWKKPR